MISIMRHWFTHTAKVYTVTESQSSDTKENITSETLLATISCRIRPLTAGERFVQHKETAIITHRLYSTFEIVNKNTVQWNSNTYEVIDVKNPMNMNMYYQADLSRVD